MYLLKRTAIAWVLMGLALIDQSCQKESPQELSQSVRDSVASADGTIIQYQVRGDNPPALVFVHGWSCDHTCWKKQVSFFSGKYRVVTLDLAGHGASGYTRKEYTMAAFGQDVTAVINKLNFKKIVLIGHSMGGAVILEAARRVPDRILCLVGVDTFQDIETSYSEEEIEQFLAPFKENFREMSREFVMNMFPLSADSSLVMEIVNKISAAPERIALSSMHNLFSYNALKTLKDIQIPLQLINCDKYPVNVAAGQSYQSDFEVTIIPNVGHFLMLEDPESFNRILEDIVIKYSRNAS